MILYTTKKKCDCIYNFVPPKMDGIKNDSKANPCNILALGSGETSSFIKNYNEFDWRNPKLNERKVIEFPEKSNRTTEISRVYFKLFDEQHSFIDTPKTCKEYSLYRALKSLHAVRIDAILIFTDKFFNKLKWYLQTFFTDSNFPRDKIIFIVNDTKVNSIVTAVNLEKKLKKMHGKVVLNENLFVIEDNFYTYNKMLSFSYRLRNVLGFPPCVIQFNPNVAQLFKIIPDLFHVLIEILHMLTAQLSSGLQKCLDISSIRITTSKKSIEENVEYCHECKCFDATENKELKDCCIFNSNTCTECLCGVEDHISTRCELVDAPSKAQKNELEYEKNTILYLMATLYQFCKHRDRLPDVCKDFKKEYWSVVKMSNVSSEEPIYKELADKIKEFESNDNQPTPEEVTYLLEHFIEESWNSFYLDPSEKFSPKYFIHTKCQLKFIKNAIPAETLGSPGLPKATQEATNNQKPLPETNRQETENSMNRKPRIFPEMKTTLPKGTQEATNNQKHLPETNQQETELPAKQNPRIFPEMKNTLPKLTSGNGDGELTEDLKDAILEILRRELQEQQVSTNKEIADLKQQIQELKGNLKG